MSTPSINFGWPIPTVDADDDVWGSELATTIADIDHQVFLLSGNVPSFPAVQQGGGTGQGNTKLYLGWNSTTGQLLAQANTQNLGAVPTGLAPSGFYRTGAATGGLVTVSTAGPSGVPQDGDLWLTYTP